MAGLSLSLPRSDTSVFLLSRRFLLPHDPPDQLRSRRSRFAASIDMIRRFYRPRLGRLTGPAFPPGRHRPLCSRPCGARQRLQTRVDRLALEREHAEDALVHAVQRLASNEPLHRLDAQREFPKRERSLVAEASVPQTLDVAGGR